MENTTFRSNQALEVYGSSLYRDVLNCGTQPVRKKVLISGFSAVRRHALAKMLSGLALEVLEARSADETAAAVSRYEIDLILVDFNLDNGGSTKFCRILKQSKATQFIPVFVLAASDDVNSEVESIESGADAFLVLPLHPQALRARVQASLRRQADRAERNNPEAVLLSLARSVEGKDPGLGQHCERLALIVSMMGIALGLPNQDILALQRAAYLHDIGKVSIPDSILFKPGPLTPEEWVVMKSHAEKGEQICRPLHSLASALPIIRHHHEKWNGSGYPDGLTGEEIPLPARILQLADVYDALTNSRCYKRAFSEEEAIAIMQEEARKGWYDPELTKQFIELIPAFSRAITADLSCVSLHALAGSLQ